MKRIIIFSAVIFCFLAAGLMVLPFVVSTQNIKQRLDERILELTASRISYKGEPRLSFSPFLGVELSDVVLLGEKQNEEEPDLLRIENLQFSLKVIPLLFGKIRFSNFKLIRPRLNLLVRENGSANWAIIGGEIDGLLKLAQVESSDTGNSGDRALQRQASFSGIKLGQFEIVDGIVETKISGNGLTFRISNLDANVDWPNLSSAWKINGQGVWRGEVFVFSNVAEYPLALFTSGKSNLKASFSSPALIASFDGQATMVSDIQLQGEASIATPSMPRLFELLLNDYSFVSPPIGDFLIQGSMSANTHEIRFNETNIKLDTNVATGNLQLYWNSEKRPKISGTLAFSALDLTPLIEAVSSKVPQATDSNGNTLEKKPFDLDIRFSAENYKIRQNNFGALAATAIVNDNKWSFDIGEADFFGGTIVATIASKTVDEANEIELKGILRNVSMGNIAREWYGGKIVATGNADVNFKLKAPGETALGNIREFFGSMNITLTDGQIDGVDLVKAIPALNNNNGFVTVDEIKGVTPFSNLSLDLLIYNGVGWITKGVAKGDENEFRLSGKADLLRGGLAIYADIRQVPTDGGTPQQARIFVGGTVKNPLVTRSPLAKNRPDERVNTDG